VDRVRHQFLTVFSISSVRRDSAFFTTTATLSIESGFSKKVERAQLGRAHGRFNAAVTGDHHHLRPLADRHFLDASVRLPQIFHIDGFALSGRIVVFRIPAGIKERASGLVRPARIQRHFSIPAPARASGRDDFTLGMNPPGDRSLALIYIH